MRGLGKKRMGRGRDTYIQTDMVTNRPTRPRGAKLVKITHTGATESLNPSHADSGTNTKINRNGQRGPYFNAEILA